MGIQAAVVLLAGFVGLSCSSDDDGNPMNPNPTPTADVTILIVANNGSNSFSPNPATIKVGQTVAWRNNHSETHTATPNAGGFTGTGLLTPGSTSAPDTVKTVGSFGYHCTPHPSMVGTLDVTP
jgi:plastocyanin